MGELTGVRRRALTPALNTQKRFTLFQFSVKMKVRQAQERGERMEENTMTGKEIINLIDKLEQEGMTAEKIIEIIKYIETHIPESN